MDSNGAGSTRMIWIAVISLSALLYVHAGAQVADNLYNYPAGDESRQRAEDIAPVDEGSDRSGDQEAPGPDESSKTAGEEAGPETLAPPEVTVEKLGEGEWKIIKPNGNPAGRIKTRGAGGYLIYDTHNLNMGIITRDELWIPRDATRKTTRVGPAEMRLYLYALDALKKIGPAE